MSGSVRLSNKSASPDWHEAPEPSILCAPQIPALLPVFQGASRRELYVWLLLWSYASVSFWLWWFALEHNIGTWRFIATSSVLVWVNLMPAYFLAVLHSARVPNPLLPPPTGRVAMIVTKAPSEPFPVVQETLTAMLRQDYLEPYDVWLADEDPNDETTRWCQDHNVKISTRRGCLDYHRTNWPRRTRCKEGNLAYSYDLHGYTHYDFVCQFDADHVPSSSYLTEVLRPFNDPQVGYVSAPSICDKNATSSWSARARLNVEASLHGALEAGYSGHLAPLCIGSHYAVRTMALKQIGGLGPELAEDHSTTLMLNAGGWKGVHALNAIAHGDGPSTFADLAVQEFQWSRSLTTILLQYTPAYLSKLSWQLRLQFLFCQLWYPLFSFFMLLMFLLPVLALLLDSNMVQVTYPEFFVRFSAPSAVLVVMAFWWRRQGLLRPIDARLLSWEGMLFLFARWPWALLGVSMAVSDHVSGKIAGFKVTPKGRARGELPLRIFVPYLLLNAVAALPVIILEDVEVARGFYFFSAANALIQTVILFVIIIQHPREGGAPFRSPLAPGAVLFVSLCLTVGAITLRAADGLAIAAIGTDEVIAHVELLVDGWCNHQCLPD